MSKRWLALVLLSLTVPIGAQEAPRLSLGLAPGGTIPLGGNASYFTFGAGAEFSAGLDSLLRLVPRRRGV